MAIDVRSVVVKILLKCSKLIKLVNSLHGSSLNNSCVNVNFFKTQMDYYVRKFIFLFRYLKNVNIQSKMINLNTS